MKKETKYDLCWYVGMAVIVYMLASRGHGDLGLCIALGFILGELTNKTR